MSEHVGEVGDSSFEESVLKSDIPVLIDFWAPWCAPCKSIAPLLEEVAEEFAGKIQISKMNVDDNPRTPSEYNIRSIPNLVFFKGGQVVHQLVGAVPKDRLVAAIEEVIQ